MAARKHDLLDLSGSEDEVDRGYDSEDAAESKGRAVKRRRTADNQDPFGFGSDEESDNDQEEEESRPKGKGRKQTKTQDAEEDEEDEGEDEEMDDEEDGGASLDTADSKPKNKLLNKKLAKLTSGKPPKKDKSGVVYLSSLPPYLKPVSSTTYKLRQTYTNSILSSRSRTCSRSETSARSQRSSSHPCSRPPPARSKNPTSASSIQMAGLNLSPSGKSARINVLAIDTNDSTGQPNFAQKH